MCLLNLRYSPFHPDPSRALSDVDWVLLGSALEHLVQEFPPSASCVQSCSVTAQDSRVFLDDGVFTHIGCLHMERLFTNNSDFTS